MELGDDVLKQIAQELVTVVGENATVNWDKKAQLRALLRSRIRRLLSKYHYPPERQEAAVALVIEQSEVLAAELAA
jgi:type I restriction enzyme R subunit